MSRCCISARVGGAVSGCAGCGSNFAVNCSSSWYSDRNSVSGRSPATMISCSLERRLKRSSISSGRSRGTTEMTSVTPYSIPCVVELSLLPPCVPLVSLDDDEPLLLVSDSRLPRKMMPRGLRVTDLSIDCETEFPRVSDQFCDVDCDCDFEFDSLVVS